MNMKDYEAAVIGLCSLSTTKDETNETNESRNLFHRETFTHRLHAFYSPPLFYHYPIHQPVMFPHIYKPYASYPRATLPPPIPNVPHIRSYQSFDSRKIESLECQLNSRKNKSLAFLCKRFVERYKNSNIIVIDAAAFFLSAEPRRIYDLLNILESTNIVSRHGEVKKIYYWHGFKDLAEKMNLIKNESLPDEATSLTRISHNFLKCFLKRPCANLSLDDICKVLSQNQEVKPRRVYDVINVFSSLGIIKKVSGGNKPRFAWNYNIAWK